MPDINEEWRERIEADFRELTADVRGLQTGVANLGTAFDKFTHRYDTNAAESRMSHQTQWPVIFAGLTLVVIILGGFMKVSLAGYVRDLNRIEESVLTIQGNRTSLADPVQDEKLKDIQEEIVAMRLQEHTTLRGDAIMHERVAENTRTIDDRYERIDERLKREIVVHDKIRGRLENRIHSLDGHVFTSHPQMNHLHKNTNGGYD